MIQAPLTLRGHNPDVLSCIANLSNDEVFTPPEMAEAMLDLVADAWADSHNGASIWEDAEVTFLDPFTKSGVFLREIVRRLTDGLTLAIPNLEKRVDHILTKQVFGIGTVPFRTTSEVSLSDDPSSPAAADQCVSGVFPAAGCSLVWRP